MPNWLTRKPAKPYSRGQFPSNTLVKAFGIMTCMPRIPRIFVVSDWNKWRRRITSNDRLPIEVKVGIRARVIHELKR